MHWRENSIILSSKALGEDLRIVTIFNREYGKCCGIFKHSGSNRFVQIGDISDISWNGKSSDHLGTFKIESIFSPFVYAINAPAKIFTIESACVLCSNGMPEKAAHPDIFDHLKKLFISFSDKNWAINYAKFEISFLREVGYGLDLSKCAITGSSDNLYYLSPKTGRAVIKEVGEKYKDKLFLLPKFLVSCNENESISSDDIINSLKITEHFLKIYFHGITTKELPFARNYLVTELNKYAVGEI